MGYLNTSISPRNRSIDTWSKPGSNKINHIKKTNFLLPMLAIPWVNTSTSQPMAIPCGVVIFYRICLCTHLLKRESMKKKPHSYRELQARIFMIVHLLGGQGNIENANNF